MKLLFAFLVVSFLITSVQAQCSADAGLDFSICGNTAVLNGSVSGNPGATVTWSSPVAGVTFSNPGAAVTTVVFSSQVAQGTPIPLVLTEYIALPSCIATDTVFVMRYLQEQAIHLVDPADSINCGRTTNLLAAQQPSYGNGYWYDSANLTQFYPSNYSNNPDSVVIAPSAYGLHNFFWVTVNGTCRDTSDAIPVNFYQQPVANAGGNYWPGLFGPDSEIKTDTVCGLCYKLNASPSAFPGTWYANDPVNMTISGNGGFNDTACINFYTVFNPPYYRELIWISDNLSCVDKDTLRLYFAPRPSGEFNATVPDCPYYCSMIVAQTWQIPNNIDYGITDFIWDIGNAEVCSPFNNQSDTIFLHWGNGTSHPVSLVTSNIWGCYSSLVQHMVNEPPFFNPSYAINPATCGNCNGEVILFTNNHTYSYEWWDSTLSISSFDTIQYGLCPNYNYQLLIAGLSTSPDAAPGIMCYDTIPIFITLVDTPMAAFDESFINYTDVPYTLTMNNLSLNANYYLWNVSDGTGTTIFSSTLENPTVTFTLPGCYDISLVSTFEPDTSWFGITRPPCYDTVYFYDLCLWPSSVDKIEISGHLSIFPNPMFTSATLTIPNFEILNSKSETGSSSDFNIRISDLSGKVVRTIPLTRHGLSPNKPSPAHFTIARGDLKPGIYFVELKADRVYRTKLVVE